MTAWKNLERRVCRALGGERRGPVGRDMSDCVGVPYAVEVKRSSRPGPPVLSKWVEQARRQGKDEGLPWLLVVAGHGDRRPIVCLDLLEFVSLRSRATGQGVASEQLAEVYELRTLDEALRETGEVEQL